MTKCFTHWKLMSRLTESSFWDMVCIHWLLSCIHLFNCSLMQMSNQPIRLQQQFSAFSHVDIIKMTCWISNWASEWGRKGSFVTLNVAWLLMADIPVCSKAAEQLGFSHMSFWVYREWSEKQKISSEWQFSGAKCLDEEKQFQLTADYFHPFTTTVYSSSDGYFQLDNTMLQSSHHLKLVFGLNSHQISVR